MEQRYVTIKLPCDGGQSFKWSVDGATMTFDAPAGARRGEDQEFSFQRRNPAKAAPSLMRSVTAPLLRVSPARAARPQPVAVSRAKLEQPTPQSARVSSELTFSQ